MGKIIVLGILTRETPEILEETVRGLETVKKWTIAKIESASRKMESPFFSAETRRFWGSTTLKHVYPTWDNRTVYFITHDTKKYAGKSVYQVWGFNTTTGAIGLYFGDVETEGRAREIALKKARPYPHPPTGV